ncbi:uncharacterized protein L969DRAFT_95641 [Mixia osmundae IAM 14324]|uniref:uncharacterized protein n=1 Tax=Mixia osmundae (strain CBS 9802 / IAM 14324 / JCM 22182 / KY 12970) TaxID=764103 RepID=UPI0004A54A52|nr:uncharacterized protein L969DRAFT_95641 [Mixia osmundae IAM 14324]KEI38565.1 hypothetical protein L969DRAFT_95641 [Mixia osmundae IAM 14324]
MKRPPPVIIIEPGEEDESEADLSGFTASHANLTSSLSTESDDTRTETDNEDEDESEAFYDFEVAREGSVAASSTTRRHSTGDLELGWTSPSEGANILHEQTELASLLSGTAIDDSDNEEEDAAVTAVSPVLSSPRKRRASVASSVPSSIHEQGLFPHLRVAAARRFPRASKALHKINLHRFLDDTSPAPHTFHEGMTRSIAPPNHRENTALHAIKDSLSLPHLPSMPEWPFTASLSLPTAIRSFTFGSSSLSAAVPPVDSSLYPQVPSPSGATFARNGQSASDLQLDTLSQDAFSDLRGPVLLMGGYRGSVLRSTATGQRLWVPLKVGIGLRKPDLSIGLSEADEDATTEFVRPDKMVTAVAGWIDLGRRLKDRLRELNKKGQIQFVNWGYDWRRSLHKSSALLLEELKRLKEESPEGLGTMVLAHSMGGLVALHALSRTDDPSLFRGIVFAGTPWGPTVNALGPLRHGDGVLFNKEICSPSVAFSMRSTFYFLPGNGDCFEDEHGNALPVDFFNPQDWSRYGLSPMTEGIYDRQDAEQHEKRMDKKEEAQTADVDSLVPVSGPDLKPSASLASGSTSPSISIDSSRRPSGNSRISSATSPFRRAAGMVDPRARLRKENSSNDLTKEGPPAPPDAVIKDYLERTLANVQQFRRELEEPFDPKKAYPPIALLVSNKTATVRGVIVDGEEDIRSGNFTRLLFGAGDGIVLHSSSQTKAMPGQWASLVKAEVRTHHGHVSLLGDLRSVSDALDAIEGKKRERRPSRHFHGSRRRLHLSSTNLFKDCYCCPDEEERRKRERPFVLCTKLERPYPTQDLSARISASFSPYQHFSFVSLSTRTDSVSTGAGAQPRCHPRFPLLHRLTGTVLPFVHVSQRRTGCHQTSVGSLARSSALHVDRRTTIAQDQKLG